MDFWQTYDVVSAIRSRNIKDPNLEVKMLNLGEFTDYVFRQGLHEGIKIESLEIGGLNVNYSVVKGEKSYICCFVEVPR